MCKYRSTKFVSMFVVLVVFLSGCDNEIEPKAKAVALDGSVYAILEQRNVLFEGDKMLVVKYLSENVESPQKLEKEFEDLYEIYSVQISPTSEYDYLAMEAVSSAKRNGRIAGFRGRKPIAEILELKQTVEAELNLRKKN